jgi:hypothetical protein
MSLLPTVKKINDQYISIFAMLDDCCDGGPLTASRTVALADSYEALREYLLACNDVLSNAKNILNGADDTGFEVPGVFPPNTLVEFAANNYPDIRKKLRISCTTYYVSLMCWRKNMKLRLFPSCYRSLICCKPARSVVLILLKKFLQGSDLTFPSFIIRSYCLAMFT